MFSSEDARFEYIYKFISRDKITSGGAVANCELLDHGILYVARFNADGSGRWLPLVHSNGTLNAAYGFADQGEVLIKARQASDFLGATKMGRPELHTIDRESGWVCCTLTNNSNRGQANNPSVDAANSRANNTMGRIIRWRDTQMFPGGAFIWSRLLLAGDQANEREHAKGNIKGDIFGCPDSLSIGPGDLLWIQTNVHSSQLNQGEIKRFLTGPNMREITGVLFTPRRHHPVQHCPTPWRIANRPR